MSRDIIEQAIRITGDISGFQAEMKKAADVAQRSFRSIEKSALQVGQAINMLNGITAAVGGGAVLRMADEFNTLKNRVFSATKATGDSVAVFKELQRITQATGASLKDTTDVFQRLALAGPSLGASNKQLLDMTKAVEQLGIIGGSSTAALNAGLLQFGQAMSSGVVHAEELNSIIENMPLVAQKIAEGMGKTTAEMRSLVIAGKITSQQVFESLKKQTQQINEEFAKMPKSLGQSMDILKESFASAFGELADKSGLITALSKALEVVANNAQLVTNAFLGIATGATIFRVMTISINGTAAAVRAFATSLLATPAGLFGTAIGVATAALIAFKDQQFQIGQYQVTLMTLMQATWEKFGPLVTAVWDLVRLTVLGTLDALWKATKTIFTAMTHVITDFVTIMSKIPIIGEPFKNALKVIQGVASFASSVEKSFAGIAKRAAEINAASKAPGNVSSAPLGTGLTGPTQAQLDALKKQAEAKEKFFRALEESNKALRLEITLGKEAAEVAEKEAQFREQVGRKMLPEELNLLKRMVAEKHKLEAFKAYKSARETLANELNMLELEIAGNKELVAGENILNGLRQQGIYLSGAQAASIREQALAIEKLKMALETKNNMKELRRSVDYKRDELDYGEDTAKVRQALQGARDKNKFISGGELSQISKLVLEEQKLTKEILTRKRLEGLDEQIVQLQQKIDLTEQEAEIYKQIREAVKENGLISNDQLSTLRQKLDVEQQLKKTEADNKAIKDFLKDQQKSVQQAAANLIQNKQLKDLIESQAALEEKLGRALTEQEQSWISIGSSQKAYLEDAKRAQDIIKENRTVQEKFQDDLVEINDLYSKGLLSLKDYNTAYRNMSPAFQEWKNTVKDLSGAFSKGLNSWIDGSKKLGEAWKDIAKNILKIASQKLLFEPLEKGLTKVSEKLFNIGNPGAATASGTTSTAKQPKGIMGLLSNLSIPLPGPLAKAASFIPGVGNFIRPAGAGKVNGPNLAKDMVINARDVFINSGGFSGGAMNAPMSTTPPPFMSKSLNPLTSAVNKLASKLPSAGLANAFNGGANALGKLGPLGQILGLPLNFLSGVNAAHSFMKTGNVPDFAMKALNRFNIDPMQLIDDPMSVLQNVFKKQNKPTSIDPILSPMIATSKIPVPSMQQTGMQNLFGGDFLGSLIAPLKGVFQNGIFSSLNGFFKNLFAGDFLGGIVNTVKGFFSNGILSGFSNIFSGIKGLFGGGTSGGGGLFSGLSSMFGGLGGLTKMTGQGGLFSTMLAPLSGLGSSLKGLGGLGNIFGGGGLFDVMTRPIRGYASGGRVLGNEPIITSEEGAEMWWPDSAGTIINNQQLNEMLLRSSMTTASQGKSMDITTSNYMGTPFYELTGGAAASQLPSDLQRDLEQFRAHRAMQKSGDPSARAAYYGQWGGDPNMTKLMQYVSQPPADLQDNVRRWGQESLNAVRDSRLAVNSNDIIGNAMLSGHHINNQFAATAYASQYLFPQGNQKGRIMRQYGYNDPALNGWADLSDMISDEINPSKQWGHMSGYAYNSSGMTWGAGGQSVVQIGDGDYETRLAAGLAEGPHIPATMNPRNNNDPRYFRTPGTGNQTSPNNAPPLNGLPGAVPSRSGLPSGWSGLGSDSRGRANPEGVVLGDGTLQGWKNQPNPYMKIRGFADGGRPPVGVPSWVGERGKELFVPKQEGAIVDHKKAMSLGGQVNVQVVNNSGTPMVPNVTRSSDGRDILVVFDELVAGAIQRGGRATQALTRQAVMQRG